MGTVVVVPNPLWEQASIVPKNCQLGRQKLGIVRIAATPLYEDTVTPTGGTRPCLDAQGVATKNGAKVWQRPTI